MKYYIQIPDYFLQCSIKLFLTIGVSEAHVFACCRSKAPRLGA